MYYANSNHIYFTRQRFDNNFYNPKNLHYDKITEVRLVYRDLKKALEFETKSYKINSLYDEIKRIESTYGDCVHLH